MRVALIGENFKVAITVNTAEYRNLLGYIGTHCDFGIVPESVFTAWEENTHRTLRDVLQFAANNCDNEIDRDIASGELEIVKTSGRHVDFVVQRIVKRRILGFIPGVAKTKVKTLDDCTLSDLVDVMFRFDSEATPV